MGIKNFHNIIFNNVNSVSLKGSVVIDAHNIFYDFYEYHTIPYAFGCEGNKLAKYIKHYLMMFKKANIDCYFVFKGGDSDFEKHFLKRTSKNELYENYTPGRKTFIHPLYVREIIKEVLDDLKFIYVSCEYEARNTCIALAQTLSCPIISLDRDFVMSNIDYIPYKIAHQKLKCINGVIECGVFNLENFLKSNNITMDHYTLFMVLTDDSIFPEDYFSRFFTKISLSMTNKYLLSWLSKQDTDSVIDQIVKLNFDKKQLLDALSQESSL